MQPNRPSIRDKGPTGLGPATCWRRTPPRSPSAVGLRIAPTTLATSASGKVGRGHRIARARRYLRALSGRPRTIRAPISPPLLETHPCYVGPSASRMLATAPSETAPSARERRRAGRQDPGGVIPVEQAACDRIRDGATPSTEHRRAGPRCRLCSMRRVRGAPGARWEGAAGRVAPCGGPATARWTLSSICPCSSTWPPSSATGGPSRPLSRRASLLGVSLAPGDLSLTNVERIFGVGGGSVLRRCLGSGTPGLPAAGAGPGRRVTS